MTLNVAAMKALFGTSTRAAISKMRLPPPLARGPCPYLSASLQSRKLGFSKKFVTGIEAVRAHPKWGLLFHGDLSAYHGDHSSGDMALCGEFARRGFDANLIDLAMRCSKLYRAKWERDDYRENTILKVLANVRSRQPSSTSLLSPHGGWIAVNPSSSTARDYVIDDLLVSSKAAILGGFGGVSKSQLAIQIATAIALGQPFLGKNVKMGNVVAIFGEEDQLEIERRLAAIAQHQELSPADSFGIEDRVRVFTLVGQDVRLASRDGKAFNETKFSRKIVECVKAIEDVRLVVLDHLSLFHGGDFNARDEAALTMRVVNHIGQATGAAVLLLAHTPKSAAALEESDASMIAGSTAFVDQSRAAWVLATMRPTEAKKFNILGDERKSYVSLTIVKNNYGPTGDVYWFKRVRVNGCAILESVSLVPQLGLISAYASLETRIVSFVKGHRGEFSKSKLRDTQSGTKNSTLRASKEMVASAIDGLLAAGVLIYRTPTPTERANFRLGPRVQQVLDVP